MANATATPVADFLDGLDSHAIYDLDGIWVDLDAIGYDGPKPEGASLAEMRRAIDARGLGGTLLAEGRPGQRLIAGYQLAALVARRLLGEAPGDAFFGRGSAFRANVAAIRAHEEGR